MDIANLFYALSQAICLSLMQGLITLLLVRLIFFIFPGIPSIWKYTLLFGSLVLLLVGFSFSIYGLYSPPAAHTISSQVIGATPQNISALAVVKHFLQSNSGVIFSAYAVGFLLNTLSLIRALYKINQLKKSPGLQELTNWNHTLEELQSKLKISRKIRLFFSEKLVGPFTTGFLKPVIYFPIAMLSHLSMEQAEAILLHELAHIKRNDYLINIIQKLIETILFFNPVVWLLARSLKSEREYCCDDLVLHLTSDVGLYARALLSLEENRIDYNNLAMAADGARKHSLLNRIKRLKVMEHVNSNPKHKLIAIVGLVAIGLSLAWAIPADSVQVKKEKAKISAKRAVPPPPPALPAMRSPEMPPPLPPALPAAIKNEDVQEALPLPPLPPAKKTGVAVQDTNKANNYLNSDEWKKQQEALKKITGQIQKYFQSPEWEAQQKAIAQNAENIKKHFESAEWKAQQKLIAQHAENIKKQFEGPEWKAEIKRLEKSFNTPEWKAQQKIIAQHAENIKKHFETPEWKAQIEELQKNVQNKFNSEEWRKQMDEVKKQVEEVKIEKQNVEFEKKKLELEIKINDEKQLNENKNSNKN